MAMPKFAGGLGFRDIETFNDALLAKVGWRLLSDPHSLLARVLLSKYAWGCSFLDCTVPTTASHGWRSVLAGRDILRKGLSWVVGNGESIRVWEDPWLSCQSPSIPIGPTTLLNKSMRVSELLCPLTNKWDVERIRRILPQYEGIILQLKTSTTTAPDTILWLPEKSGSYSVKTGYGLGMTSESSRDLAKEPVNWLQHVWNVKTIPKLKDFLWRVVKKAITVSANLELRGFPRLNCKKCGIPEDDLHVLLNCPLALEVWRLAPIIQHPGIHTPSVAELLKQGSSFTPLPPVGLTTPLWPWLLWNLWKARNKLFFENKEFTAQEIITKSIKDVKEWANAQVTIIDKGSSRRGSDLSPAGARLVCPPPSFPPGTLVCRVDAAWDVSTGGCGIGGIFTGDDVQPLSTISEAFSHVTSALMAEAIAVHRAVSLAVYSNVRSLAVLTDSLSLVNLLKKGGYQPELFVIMFDIYHFMSLFDVISFDFISRNFNSDADSVAKSALALYVANSVPGA